MLQLTTLTGPAGLKLARVWGAEPHDLAVGPSFGPKAFHYFKKALALDTPWQSGVLRSAKNMIIRRRYR